MFGRRNFEPIFQYICEEAARVPVGNIKETKPLCSTRWIYRKSQIEEIIKKHSLILDNLGELSEDNYDGASGLLQSFPNGLTDLGKKTPSGTFTYVEIVLAGLRDSCCDKIDELNLEPLTLRKTARSLKRFCEP
ncbi:hypothetical protein PR048_014486 [Dryococelus australis]|uniref:Uncharacterized protein n=1 Tax=Dryococelus australis TaxID=614101 RepID=A0ABQ9HEE0_9NEOP|nr:hypothetical protein PR048_014486 [Dryococelus australis]